MRILRCIVSILFIVILILLAISTIRVVVSGGGLGSLSFYSFLQFLQNDMDFDAQPFFTSLSNSLEAYKTALSDLIRPDTANVTGVLVIDKILSFFVGFGNSVIAVAKGVYFLLKAPLDLMTIVFDFLEFIYHCIAYLFGFGMQVSAVL